MQKIIPCLWFDDQVEETVKLYTSTFSNSKVGKTAYYDKASAEVSGRKEGSVLTIDFELGGVKFVGLNGGPVFKITPAISFSVACDSEEEIDKLYKKLVEDGNVLMPLDKYSFGEKYAWINDKYGVSWQLIIGKQERKIVPALMFTGKNAGKAEEAMKLYTSLFNNSKINDIFRYGKNDGDTEGNIAHAEFTLDGEKFIAMDSGLSHKFNFTEGVSLIVNCKDQEEVDKLWNALSAVPESEQCGWLRDKYGVSWQIVPTILDKLLTDPDPEKARRTMEAMLEMKKLDIRGLQSAYDGK